MRVIATQKGFYGTLRNPGEVFEIANKQAFSERWMEKAPASKPITRPELEPDGKKRTVARKRTVAGAVNNIKDVPIEQSADEKIAQERARAEAGEPEPPVSRRRRRTPGGPKEHG